MNEEEIARDMKKEEKRSGCERWSIIIVCVASLFSLIFGVCVIYYGYIKLQGRLGSIKGDEEDYTIKTSDGKVYGYSKYGNPEIYTKTENFLPLFDG